MQETLTPPDIQTSTVAVTRPPWSVKTRAWVLFFVVALFWALYQVGFFQNEIVNAGGWPVAGRFITASLRPDLSLRFIKLTLEATLITLAYAVLGIFFSLLFGFFGGVLASQTWWIVRSPPCTAHHPVRKFQLPWLFVRSVLAPLRAIHEIIWGLFFINIIGLDPLSAILAISIPFGAITAKVFSEIIDETSRQPLEALVNSGVTPAKAFAYTVLPQAITDLISYSFYRFECAIRAAAVLGIIGAGGLGYQIFLSLQTLKYSQVWTLLYALFILNGLADFWSALIRRRIGASRACCDLAVGLNRPGEIIPRRRNQGSARFVKFSLVLGALLASFSFWYVAPDFGNLLSTRTRGLLVEIARNSFPPDFSTLSLSMWLEQVNITLSMSLIALGLAGVSSLVVSFPAANNFLLPGGLLDRHGSASKTRRFTSVFILVIVRVFLLVARSVPPPIWALVFLFVLFPGLLPGAIALGLYTFGVLGRLTAEVVENLDDRPLRALTTQGAGGVAMFAYGVLPLTFGRYLSYIFYRWEESIRTTVVVGLVGAGGLGRVLTEQLSNFDYHGVFATLVIFVGLTLSVDLVSASARRVFRAV